MILRKIKTGVKTFSANEDIIEYKGRVTVVVAKEFNVYNLGDYDIEIQFNGCEDLVLLEPGEGFSTNMEVRHAIVMTEGAVIKYSYWV